VWLQVQGVGRPQRGILPGACRQLGRIAPLGDMGMVGRGGDRQDLADRLGRFPLSISAFLTHSCSRAASAACRPARGMFAFVVHNHPANPERFIWNRNGQIAGNRFVNRRSGVQSSQPAPTLAMPAAIRPGRLQGRIPCRSPPDRPPETAGIWPGQDAG